MKSKFRTKYEPRTVAVSFEGVVSQTDQQFKDDCSIEGIIRRYGVLPPSDIRPMEADVSDIGDFEDCMRKVQDGMDHFASLPSDVRSRFGNDPKAFFAWISNPVNTEEAIKVGLMLQRKDEPSVGERLDRIADKLDKVVTSQEGKQA